MKDQLISFLKLRSAIGILGFFLPIILVLTGNYWAECSQVQESLSAYYHTQARDVFVALLFATGTLFLTYKGYGRLDSMVANIAGFSAMGIALFPTSSGGVSCPTVAGYTFPDLHIVFAILFFSSLIVFSLYIFRKKDDNPTPEKLKRNRIYAICGWIMLISTSLILINWMVDRKISHLLGMNSIFTLAFEWVALAAFGISWITKGEIILADLKN